MASPGLSESQIIVVSNRLPVSLKKERTGWNVKLSSGGLVAALSGMDKEKYPSVWVGWPGCGIVDEEKDEVAGLLRDQGCVPVFLSEKISDEHYNGFSNGVLWPLFHYLHNNLQYNDKLWTSYLSANQSFADTVESIYRPGDTIWIHDLHLMLVAKMLRRQLPKATIGFFLHIPFPSPEIFKVFPWKREVLSGVLECDLVGFHTYEYAQNFLRTCAIVLGLETKPNGVTVKGKFVRVGVFPIGIEPKKFLEKMETEKVQKRVEELKAIFAGKQVIIGVDRLDYIKGVPHKLLGFEGFLEKYPEWRDKVVLVQVAVPSRADGPEYKQLKDETDELVGRINGAFAVSRDKYNEGVATQLGRVAPVQYLYRSVDMDELCALYRVASCCFVTSIRDGMNLVCLEYIASQQGTCGSLILSEFAGAAQSLCGGAILINPWNTDEMVDALHTAMTMTPEQRQVKHDLMFNYVMKYTSAFWGQLFITELHTFKPPSPGPSAPSSAAATPLSTPLLSRAARVAVVPALPHEDSSPNLINGVFSPNILHSLGKIDSPLLGLYSASPRMSRPTSPSVGPIRLNSRSLQSAYKESSKRLFLLSYEGTLVPQHDTHHVERPSWKLLAQLKELAKYKENEIVILSEHNQKNLMEWFNGVRLILVSNGMQLRPGCTEWEPLFPEVNTEWKEAVRPLFKYYTVRTPGAKVEETDMQMQWDYSKADITFGKTQARELNQNLDSMPLKVIRGNKTLTVTPHEMNTTTIVQRIIGQMTTFDFMFSDCPQANIVAERMVEETESVSKCFVFQMGEAGSKDNSSTSSGRGGGGAGGISSPAYYMSDSDELQEVFDLLVAS
eukprot:TRINITY_DN7201_c0_g1_i5.p1 TRINITY_DN7201_c0_g1~~TRINITY_DN7201_c0_g1_i5.p1  ORF type:complete len:847 (-),score=163.89 TRINITY_DN7201_c0_g1_i5:109-2625(-)